MKGRIMITALAACLLLSAAGCGPQQDDEEMELSPLAPVTEQRTASESSAAALPDTVPASAGDTVPAEESSSPETPEAAEPALYEEAQELIGGPVQELFDVIGEPQSSQYAASCEKDGADDGMLFYEGFYIWTLRTDEEEIVRAVYLDD